MTRIVSYNILAGGYSVGEGEKRRTPQLTQIIRSTHPDVVGLAEAINLKVRQRPWVVEELAEALGMQLVMGEESPEYHDYQLALLTRLPVVYKKIHNASNLFIRPMLEVCVEEEGGQRLTIFVIHLSAAFNRGWAGNGIRQREIQEILRIVSKAHNTPHILLGDFNSLAPGDAFKASFLVRYVVELDRKRRGVHVADGNPYLDFVVPKPLKFLKPLLRAIPRNHVLRTLFDTAAALYAPRGTISMIQQAGYVDCYRRVHPDAWGFTCPAVSPAGRIDFIFASPMLADRLESCDPVTDSDGLPASSASDHLAVVAEFGLRVEKEQHEEGQPHDSINMESTNDADDTCNLASTSHRC